MKCPDLSAIAAAVDRQCHAPDSDAILAHIDTCQDCAANRRHLEALIAGIGEFPTRDSRTVADEVVARLDSAKRDAPTSHRWPALGVAGVLVTAVALAILWLPATTDQATFTARGGATPSAPPVRFVARWHTRPTDVGTSVKDGSAIPSSAGFSFTIFNDSGSGYNAWLFGVDSTLQVHWFYPEYRDPEESPSPLWVPAWPLVQNLPQGVTPEQLADKGTMALVGLFSARAWTVAGIESLIDRVGVAGLAEALPETVIQIQNLNVVQLEEPQ